MAFLLLPMEIHPGAKNRSLRRCAWCMYSFLVLTFLTYAAVVFVLAYRTRNVPAVSLDYKVEETQLPNIYICPFAFFSHSADLLPIKFMSGFCNAIYAKEVVGVRATGLKTHKSRGSVNWAFDNVNRNASRYFVYDGDRDSDCEIEGVELALPNFERDGLKGIGSSMCLRFNTSRFSFTTDLIGSSFTGLQMSFAWTLPPSAPPSGYLKGGNIFAAYSDKGVLNGIYDVPASIIGGGGLDSIQLSLSVRKYLNGSEKLSGSMVATHVDTFNSSYGSSFPNYDYVSGLLYLNPQGRLHIVEKSSLNWTIILSQIVAGWTLVTAVFGMFFAYDLRRRWTLPWPLEFKEVEVNDNESKDITEQVLGRSVRSTPDLYPNTI